MTTSLIIVLLIIFFFAAGELLYPSTIREGFDSLIGITTPGYFSQFVPKRGDVGVGEEESGYLQDGRYFRGYADVQGLGVSQDFCRMVQEESSGDSFFACALAGTDNLSSVKYRTLSVKSGFKMSRDDYMNKGSYCRILKDKNGGYEALCNRPLDNEFDVALRVDQDPPQSIQTLLTFYSGCMFWMRFRDDMIDYVSNAKAYTKGGLEIEESPPNPPVTRGLSFNGIDHFIRLADNADLELGDKVKMRSLRAIMLWVYFDEFTNNTHILDFGNGAGRDNVVLGIVGKGDPNVFTSGDIRPPLLYGADSTVPTGKTGAQPVEETTPQEAMFDSKANVDEYTSEGFELDPRRLPPSRVTDLVKYSMPAEKATLLYEIWDQQQRKMRIVIPGLLPKKKWTHLCVTATGTDSFRPDIAIYMDGEQVFLEAAGWLPQASTTSNNYIGKSNWTNETSQYENKNELFKGSLFDVRGYKVPLSEKVIKDSIVWGKDKLGLI